MPCLGPGQMNLGGCMRDGPDSYGRGTSLGRGPVFGQLSAKEKVTRMLSHLS